MNPRCMTYEILELLQLEFLSPLTNTIGRF
uniref:Uncharacterized protein n=1 Tax=Setaria italica TaxID=4555 RepID=K3XTU6_SETIT